MAISVAAAVLGFLLAWTLYISRPQLPARIAAGLGGLYKAVFNKYYIDELYAVVFIKPVIDGSTEILWHDVDQGAIDATVNNAATPRGTFPTRFATCSPAICAPMRAGWPQAGRS